MSKKYLGGGPKGKHGFPVGDAKHARLAIGGATRSYHAGNISASKMHSIQSQARSRLRSFKGPRGS
jgi:hypothetical protein